MSHVMCHDVSLAHKHLMVAAFIIRVCVENHRIHVLSLDMIGHGMMWQRMLLCSHGIHIHTGLMCMLSHGFT